MAITTEITTNMRAADLPDGYTVPSTTITLSADPVEEAFATTLTAASVADAANDDQTMADLLAATKAWVDGTWIPNTLKLDAAATINGIIYVTRIARRNSQTNKFLLGADTYYVYGTLKYD